MDIIMGSGRWVTTMIVTILLGFVPSNDCNLLDNSREGLEPGSGVSIFKRYGYLSVTMRVIFQDQLPYTWVFREKTTSILQSATPLQTPAPIRGQDEASLIEDFPRSMLAFCDDTTQLMEAYFRTYRIEGLDRPWAAFSAHWPKENCAKELGVTQRFFDADHYSYILLQLPGIRTTGRMNLSKHQPIRFKDRVEEQIVVGNYSLLLTFFYESGTHYIHSYTTGNGLYQVFVYRKPVYNRIKARFQAEGVTSVNALEAMTYLSPWYAVHTGRIYSNSGNSTVEVWAEKHLTRQFYLFSYSSLASIFTEPALLRTLGSLLRDEALLQIELRTLEPAFANEQRRRYFSDTLNNLIKLWESNFGSECSTPGRGSQYPTRISNQILQISQRA